MPPPSREQAVADAAEEIAAYAFIRAWMADDVDKGMLMIEQHHVPPEAALFVMSLVKAASRALLSAEGYQVDRALAVLDQWLENASERAAP
jgi:hypothetical protein